jgi:hypothetical protein
VNGEDGVKALELALEVVAAMERSRV